MDAAKQLREENAKLLELLRWRKWPEEKPEVEGDYQTLTLDIYDENWDCSFSIFTMHDGPNRDKPKFYNGVLRDVSYWRPVGPLPEGKAAGR